MYVDLNKAGMRRESAFRKDDEKDTDWGLYDGRSAYTYPAIDRQIDRITTIRLEIISTYFILHTPFSSL